jgi:pimeloyl-ACP methyl ester carboxylesterase
MLDAGWVVVATDYVAMGTPGTPLYLVGASEARDVVNSVRAARQVPGADAGTRWGVWGHSQGGHAALWTGALAATLAPELQLVGVAAAAPAAELDPLIGQQWDQPVAWVIGPPVAISWPVAHPTVALEGVVSKAGIANLERIAYECIKPAAIEGMVRNSLKETFFAVDPMTDAAWTATILAETPPVLPPDLPLFLAQGTTDPVVLPNTTALLDERFCAAGSMVTMSWMGGVGHMKAGEVAGPDAVSFLWARFAGQPATSTCGAPPAVAPYGG